MTPESKKQQLSNNKPQTIINKTQQQPKTKINLKQKGNQYYKQSQYALAAAMYRKYVSKPHDDNKNAYYNMSLCYFKLQRYEECIEMCQQALRIDDALIKVYYRLALAYEKINNWYQSFANANEYCLRKEEQMDQENVRYQESSDYLSMKQLRERMKNIIVYPNPVPVQDKNKIFDSSYVQLNTNKQQKQTKKEQIKMKQTIQYFEGYNWSDVQQSLSSGHLSEALNKSYSIVNKNDSKSVINKQNLKIVRQISAGRLPKQAKLLKQNSINTNQSNAKKSEINGSQSAKVQDNHHIQQQKGQKKLNKINKQQVSIKQNSASQKQQQTYTQQKHESKYLKYFLKSLQSKPDVFQGFLTVILQLVHNYVLTTQQKQQIFITASKQYQMFKILKLSLTQKQKSKIKKQFNNAKLSKNIIDIYCS